MGKKINVTLTVELDEHEASPEEIAERIRGSIAETVKAGHLDLDATETLESWDVRATVGKSTVESLATLDTWEERCRREAIEEYGYRTEADIAEHTSSAQTDLDYLVGQDQTLEGLIASARREVGYEAPEEPIPQDQDEPGP